MRRSIIIMLCLICSHLNLYSQSFYDVSRVNNVEIYFEQANWDSLLSSYWHFADETRLNCRVNINGQQFDSVGVRYKGSSTYRRDEKKNPLNIKLDHLIPDQNYQGIQTLKLSNGYFDPSFLREVLGYEIARKYMPASRANYVNVFINDEYYGVYINVETVDRRFLDNYFEENNGVFIKGDPLRSIDHAIIGTADFRYKGDDSTEYYNSYDIKSERGWRELVELCRSLKSPSLNIEDVLNVDRALWLLAFHNVLVSLDSPINSPRNFYLYRDRHGRFNLIPWDLNMTFGQYKIISNQSGITIEDLINLDPFHNENNADYPLVRKLLTNPEYRRIYIAHMKTIIKENFSNGWYNTQGRKLQDIIAYDVISDPNKYYTVDEFWENLETTIGGEYFFIPGIADLMNDRANFLQFHPDLAITPPEISEISHYPSPVKPNSKLTLTTRVINVDNVIFAYRYDKNELFSKVQMLDDGNQSDGAAGDDIYGISVNAGVGGLQYYIYAEHDFAASFSPERAEYEYYTLTPSGDLVINEFLASNDSAKADEAREYDDWIELYNNTNVPISLNGYFLSDKSDNLIKWQLPDTTIDENGYLLIWADEDSTQGPMHANFKLSATGERIYLLNSDQNIIDQVTFQQQVPDISSGRSPNGTGQFIQMTPTAGLKNLDEIIKDPDIPDEYELNQNYPNPFNPTTTISFSIPQSTHVNLTIYNLLGQKIITLMDEFIDRGPSQFIWNGMDESGKLVSSGIYFYQLSTDQYSDTKRMLLLK